MGDQVVGPVPWTTNVGVTRFAMGVNVFGVRQVNQIRVPMTPPCVYPAKRDFNASHVAPMRLVRTISSVTKRRVYVFRAYLTKRNIAHLRRHFAVRA